MNRILARMGFWEGTTRGALHKMSDFAIFRIRSRISRSFADRPGQLLRDTPGPVGGKAFSVPSKNVLGLDDDQGLFPISPEPGPYQPKDSIRLANSRPPALSMEHREPLTESEVLEC